MTRILGVDFSGASDAGRKIWVAEGRFTDAGALQLLQCVPAMDLPGGGVRPEQAVPALTRHVAALDDARVGPHGLRQYSPRSESRGGPQIPPITGRRH